MGICIILIIRKQMNKASEKDIMKHLKDLKTTLVLVIRAEITFQATAGLTV